MLPKTKFENGGGIWEGINGGLGKGKGEGLTAIVFAVVADHKHNFPIKDIVVYQSTRDSGEVLRCLYFLELSCEQARSACGCHAWLSVLR